MKSTEKWTQIHEVVTKIKYSEIEKNVYDKMIK